MTSLIGQTITVKIPLLGQQTLSRTMTIRPYKDPDPQPDPVFRREFVRLVDPTSDLTRIVPIPVIGSCVQHKRPYIWQ